MHSFSHIRVRNKSSNYNLITQIKELLTIMLFSQNYLLLSHYFAYKLYNSYIRNIKPT